MKETGTTIRIVIVSIAIAGIAYGAAWLLPKNYRARATLYFPQSQGGGGGGVKALLSSNSGGGDAAAQVAPGVQIPQVGSSEQIATALMQSRDCLYSVVRELGLTAKWKLPSDKLAVEKLDDEVTASVEKSGLVAVAANSETPELSEKIVASMLKHLGTKSKSLSASTGKYGTALFRARVKQQEETILEIQKRMEKIMGNAPYSNAQEVGRRLLTTMDSLADAEQKRAAASATLTAMRSSASQALNSGQEVEDKIAAYNVLTSSLQKMAVGLQEKKTALETMRATYTDESQEVKNAVKELETMKQISKQQENADKQILNENLTQDQRAAYSALQGLDASIASLKSTIANYKEAMVDSPRQFAEVTSIQADFTTALQLKGQLVGQLQIAEIAEARDPSLFEVVDKPEAGSEPVAPQKGKIALGFLLLAFAIQVVPVLGKKLKDQPE